MYLIARYEGSEAQRQAREAPPFGPGWDESIAQQATTLEIWGTRFDEGTEDRVEYRLFHGSRLVAARSIAGY